MHDLWTLICATPALCRRGWGRVFLPAAKVDFAFAHYPLSCRMERRRII